MAKDFAGAYIPDLVHDLLEGVNYFQFVCLLVSREQVLRLGFDDRLEGHSASLHDIEGGRLRILIVDDVARVESLLVNQAVKFEHSVVSKLVEEL